MIYGTAKDGLMGSLDPVHNAALVFVRELSDRHL